MGAFGLTVAALHRYASHNLRPKPTLYTHVEGARTC